MSSRPSEELERMSLLQHLEELRFRLVWSLLSVGIAFLPCWYFVEEIFNFLQKPILAQLEPGQRLVYTGIADPLFLYIKVAALAAVFIAAPFILYQIWRFISPGLYRRERLYVLPFLFFGSVFFIGGGAFAYYFAFPKAADFLLGMAKQFQPMIEVDTSGTIRLVTAPMTSSARYSTGPRSSPGMALTSPVPFSSFCPGASWMKTTRPFYPSG